MNTPLTDKEIKEWRTKLERAFIRSGLSLEDSQDIASTVVTHVGKYYDPSKAKLTTYTWNLAQRQLIDHLRKRKRSIIVEISEEQFNRIAIESNLNGVIYSPEERIERVLSVLNEEEKSFVLKVLSVGMEDEDKDTCVALAEKMGISYKKFRCVRRKIMNKLAASKVMEELTNDCTS